MDDWAWKIGGDIGIGVLGIAGTFALCCVVSHHITSHCIALH